MVLHLDGYASFQYSEKNHTVVPGGILCPEPDVQWLQAQWTSTHLFLFLEYQLYVLAIVTPPATITCKHAYMAICALTMTALYKVRMLSHWLLYVQFGCYSVNLGCTHKFCWAIKMFDESPRHDKGHFFICEMVSCTELSVVISLERCGT